MASNYPPGVSGNEPQITGEWPIEDVVDEVVGDLNKAQDIMESALNALDEQGALPRTLESKASEVLDKLAEFKDGVLSLIPEEPDYEPEPPDDWDENR